MSTVKMPISRVTRDLTVRVDVTGVRAWNMRLWLGVQVIKLAARVIGCGIVVDGFPRQPASTNAVHPRADSNTGTPPTRERRPATSVHAAIVRLSPWSHHQKTCARVLQADECDCGLQATLREVDPR